MRNTTHKQQEIENQKAKIRSEQEKTRASKRRLQQLKNQQRIQKEIERWVLQFPDQYFWMHRRFKTRPLGEKSLYEP